MAKFLLVAAAAVAVSSWAGGGGVLVEGNGAIIFRDALKMPPLVTKEKPPCVDQSNVAGDVCENDPEYDSTVEQYVNQLLKNNREVNSLVRNPALRNILNDVDREVVSDKIDTRISVTETPVCSAQETLIYPKRAKTSRSEWVFVLNQEGVQQALRVEKCVTDGSSCNIGMVLPGDAKATCRQKYVYRRMLVLGTNKIEPEEVLMPSCCVCYTTYQGLLTRSRNGTGNQTPASASPPTADQPPPATQPLSHQPVSFVRSSRSHPPFFSLHAGRR